MFKAGDKVRVKDSNINKSSNVFHGFIGQIFTIKEIEDDIAIKLQETTFGDFLFLTERFELVKPEKPISLKEFLDE